MGSATAAHPVEAKLRFSGAHRRPLRSAPFRHLAAAYTINELGNWVGDVALAILVFDRTGSALATAALFLALRFVPALLAPLLTTRLVVVDASRVLPALHVLEGLIFMAIAWLATHFSLPAALILAALDGLLAITAKALTRGSTAALLLADGQLRQGNAILNLGFTAGGAVGPAVAGVLVAALGPGSALLVDAGTFLCVAVILATAGTLRVERHSAAGAVSRLRAGIGEAWSRPGVRVLLAAQALALVFFSAVVPIEVVYAKQTLHAGDSGYGALLAAWGAGMVVGGIAYAAAPRLRLVLVLAVSTALIGIGYGGLALAPGLALACAFSAVGGLGNGAQWIAVVTAVQQAVSARAQSSVMAVLESINQIMPAAGFILGGLLVAFGSPRAAYAVAAGGVLLVLAAASVAGARRRARP
ncbi:MAG TPA: MFS transporter [Solirubrobacteraceae bacterium]|nr:MFS transporter [Solirubrobacteraceae bacterium]